MRWYMHACVYFHILRVHICMYIYIYVCIYSCMCVWTYMFSQPGGVTEAAATCAGTCMCACVDSHALHLYTYLYIDVCIYLYMYICIYMFSQPERRDRCYCYVGLYMHACIRIY